MQTNFDPSTGIIIKSDRSGRVRYTDEFKREVLAGYESSSLSGPDFVSGQQSHSRIFVIGASAMASMRCGPRRSALRRGGS